MRKYICEGLASYLAKSYKPWHMPGHKRKNYIDDLTGEADMNMAAFSAVDEKDEASEWAFNMETILTLVASMDVTEVPGTDDLHHPEDMIYKSQAELAKTYGTYASYYMINGSTGGILAAIGAVAGVNKSMVADGNIDCESHYGDKQISDCGSCQDRGKKHIIIARNCHKSVYNACQLFGLKPIYLESEYIKLENDILGQVQQEGSNSYIYGDVKPQQVKALVDANPDVAAVVITSPTYEGVVSDIAGITKVLELYNIPLIVDEAHGAHLPFIRELPESAVNLGADIVVQSLHKTLPAMTQTAIMHVNNKELNETVRKYLSVFMSSSPSYVMLCSMELAVADALERKNREEGYGRYLESLKSFRRKLSNLTNIKLLGKAEKLVVTGNCTEDSNIFAYDDTRIVLYSLMPGEALAKRLREIGNIEVEMSGTNYVVLISTYVDSSKDFEHLERTIKLLDEELDQEGNSSEKYHKMRQEKTFSKEELYKLVGTVAVDNVYVYPPGSYIVAAGEVITKEAVDKIIQLKCSGKRIVGLRGE